MSATRKTTHTEEALAFLTAQFDQATNLRALLQIYVDPLQELEDVFFDVLDQFNVDDATGASLDIIGAIVGEDRSTRNDDDYRLAIKVRIAVLTSEGTREELIELVRAMIAGATVKVEEYYPASVVLHVVGAIDPDLVDPTQVSLFLNEAAGAGIGVGVVLHVAGPFQYDAGLGFDDGKYAEIF